MARMKKITLEISEAHILGAVSALGIRPKDEEAVYKVVEERMKDDSPIEIDLKRLREEDKDNDLNFLPMLIGVAALLQIFVDCEKSREV